jgi:hypothetical protein
VYDLQCAAFKPTTLRGLSSSRRALSTSPAGSGWLNNINTTAVTALYLTGPDAIRALANPRVLLVTTEQIVELCLCFMQNAFQNTLPEAMLTKLSLPFKLKQYPRISGCLLQIVMMPQPTQSWAPSLWYMANSCHRYRPRRVLATTSMSTFEYHKAAM